MSSVRGIDSWQDAYIFCLQPNFQDDLWLFMIFAAIQVSLAGLKLTSFFINRWARGSKVGSGDDDEDNVGDDGASGGISIMGVLTLIAGALILAAYCDDEPDEKTFNIFKAGVYLNTFLFAVALIFICGLVIAFVIDILTRRRGRSITFRMFLGGTIVLSIAASFFGATGIMGLKYIQNDCFDEVHLYFDNPTQYILQPKEFAYEDLAFSKTMPTKESLFTHYRGNMIGDPYIFTEKIDSDNNLYVYSVLFKAELLSRKQLLELKVKTAEFTYNSDGVLTGLQTQDTDASCFETVGGFGEVDGVLTCGIRYSQFQQAYARYEEATKMIVDREQCAFEESDLKCDVGVPSFPLCCSQFDEKYTWTEGCACLNSPTDASCKFNKDIVGCNYDLNTLDLSDKNQRDYYCGKTGSTTGWCEKSGESYSWKDTCKSETTTDGKYTCCQNANVWSSTLRERTWYKWGQEIVESMVPSACEEFNQCHDSSDFYSGCCDTISHPDCKYCKVKPADKTEEIPHAAKCGYTTDCYFGNIQDKIECCSAVEKLFGFTFPDDSVCKETLTYDPCDIASSDSLACKTVTDNCNKSKDCFPNCCLGLKFDFATKTTRTRSIDSDCFQLASELVEEIHDKDDLLGNYIYHKTGKETSGRPSCKKVNGIIDPKCCNKQYEYGEEDPCFCHSTVTNKQNKCDNVHHGVCLPNSDQYPQCCFDIGDFFGNDHYCTCRFEENLIDSEEKPTCNDVNTSSPSFEFIEVCPNPCLENKAIIEGDSMICELPVFKL